MTNSMLSVSQLNRYVKALLDENKLLTRLLVKGEISNLSDHYSSGHLYISLKDAGASVRAVMFKSYAQQLRFRPRNGQTVIASCSVSLYERDGTYQLYVYDLQPDGAGALALAFQQLKEKLAGEGLFAPEHKKPIPPLPQTVGVVTSASGAALQDILNILGRRYPLARVVLAPALVQGEGASDSLIAALCALNEQVECDVIILGRGGGSAEDLWAFNSEALARAIYDSAVPVISAVGHETDFTIADFVADLRAPTPSAAAELVSPDLSDLREELTGLQVRMEGLLERRLARLSQRLELCRSHRALQSPIAVVAGYEQRLQRNRRRLVSALDIRLREGERRLESERSGLASAGHAVLRIREQQLTGRVRLLGSLSPLNVLARGYAIAFDQNEKAVTDSAAVQPGDRLHIRLARGELAAKVIEAAKEKSDEKTTDAGAGDATAG